MKKLSNFFRDKSLLFKIVTPYIISLLFIGFIGYSFYIINSIKYLDREVSIYRNNLIKENKIFVSNIVNIALKGITVFYKKYENGVIDLKTAQKASIDFINSIRYIDQMGHPYGYLWINTIDGIMLVDPPKPELNNKNVLNFKDKKGFYLFKEMIKIANIKGEGFIKYCWKKLGDNSGKCYDKISFIKFFPQWGWIIGSGFYIVDAEKTILEYKKRKQNDILSTIFYSLIFGFLATIFSSFIFIIIVYNITAHLKKLGKISSKLSTEEVTPDLKIPYSSKDEIGSLVSNFNFFIDESYKLMIFKKAIENDENLENVYQRIGNLLIEEFSITTFNIFEVNNSKNAIKLVTSSGDFCCKQEIFIDSSLCRAVRTASVVDSREIKNICMNFICEGNLKYICIPLIISGNVGNIIQIVLKEENLEHFSEELSRLKKYLNEAAPVIEAKRLFSQLKESTLKDPLTGLYNRRFLDESVEIFAATALRRKTIIAILMCDIDYFKKVNDFYGHNVGDIVLQSIAKRLKSSVRNSDLVIRFGGEEFLVILQDVKDEETAINIAEKIRKNIENLEITVNNNILKKTISIGMSLFPVDTDSFWKCIKFSDVALYKAKESGRNKVIRFESTMWQDEEF